MVGKKHIHYINSQAYIIYMCRNAGVANTWVIHMFYTCNTPNITTYVLNV